jgi:basic membrane protein A
MPGTVVTSMIKRGDVAVFDIVRDVVEGRFAGGMRVFGLSDDGVDWVHEGPHAAGIPDDVKRKVAALRAEVIAGRVSVPNR